MFTRRDFLGQLGGVLATAALPHFDRGASMSIVCCIRYELDPFQRDAFAQYARTWASIIPRCGGDLIGYFLPHEGTSYEAWALIGFESLAGYEQYRARLQADPDGRANFGFAQSQRFILREERTFLAPVPETLNRRPK